MGIQQKLHTKLVQKLILTPSLQQAIKLLPMSTLELSDLLNQEMVENPMLEEVPTEELQPAEAAATPEKAEPEQAANKTDTWDDQDYEYFFGDYLDDGYRPRAPQEVKELPPIENTLSTASSLTDHLMWQLSMQTDDSIVRDIGAAIIGNLDDDGYLVASFEELAAMGPWPVGDVERALKLVQGFDPTGVAARDLQECLLLQIRHLGLENTPTEKVVTDHLRLLQNHQVPEIARKLGMTIDDLKEHIEIIRNLDPKPGSRFNPTQSQYVIPDVYVMKVEDEYVVVLNEDGLPQMRISPVYRRLLDKSASDNTDETRAYVKDKFRSALWLIKSVEQRQKTIFKVAIPSGSLAVEGMVAGGDAGHPGRLHDPAVSGVRAQVEAPRSRPALSIRLARPLFTGADILAGQQIFLRNGLMEYGSIFGHGAYLGPDLHRRLPAASRARRPRPVRRRALRPGAARAPSQDFKTNRYDPTSGHAPVHRARRRPPSTRRRSATTQSFFAEPTTRHRPAARGASPTRSEITPAHRLLRLVGLGGGGARGRARATPTPTTGRRSRWSTTSRRPTTSSGACSR